MSADLRTDAERDADNARVNQAVAEDVAVGMAAKADAERARANNFAVGAAAEAARADALGTAAVASAARADALGTAAVREATRADSALNDRDTALATAQRANRDARNSSMAFYLLLGAVAIASLIGLLWFFNKPHETVTTAPAPAPLVNRAPAPTVPRTVAPGPAVAAPAPPVIIERKVVVPVDRPVVVPVPVDRPVPVVVPAPAAPQNDTPPATTSVPATNAPATGSGEKPLRGYVEPATNGNGGQ